MGGGGRNMGIVQNTQITTPGKAKRAEMLVRKVSYCLGNTFSPPLCKLDTFKCGKNKTRNEVMCRIGP